MARRTRAAVSGFTFSESLMVRETVAVETFALLATSLMFMQVHEEVSREGIHSSNDCQTKEFAGHDVYAGHRAGTLLSGAFEVDLSLSQRERLRLLSTIRVTVVWSRRVKVKGGGQACAERSRRECPRARHVSVYRRHPILDNAPRNHPGKASR